MPRAKVASAKGIALGGDCCVICGWRKSDKKGNLLVEGAHVRQFNNESDYDSFDNIIGLCPNHHTEFDAGNIGINIAKMTVVHIDPRDPINDKNLFGNVKHIKTGYFDYHNKHVFKGKIVK